MEEEHALEVEDAPHPDVEASAGERLRSAREEQELSVEQVASRTRIPQRHIETIEAGDFAALPARTYAVGFSRTYAKAVGLDPRAIVEQVREELGAESPGERYASQSQIEPGDPARAPSRGLVFFSIAALALLLAGGFMFYRTYFAPGSGPGSLVTGEERMRAEAEAEARQAGAAPTRAAPPRGPVVFTAEDEIWVRVYDGTEDNVLIERVMTEGETFTVPADAANPQINTGRPEALGITIGGRAVPRLSDTMETINQVPIDAAALLARSTAPADATQGEEDGGAG